MAYAVLFGGMMDLVRRRLEPPMTEDMMLAVAEFKSSPAAMAHLGNRPSGQQMPDTGPSDSSDAGTGHGDTARE